MAEARIRRMKRYYFRQENRLLKFFKEEIVRRSRVNKDQHHQIDEQISLTKYVYIKEREREREVCLSWFRSLLL